MAVVGRRGRAEGEEAAAAVEERDDAAALCRESTCDGHLAGVQWKVGVVWQDFFHI
jgi:hypothetical protein